MDNFLGDKFCKDINDIFRDYWYGFYSMALDNCINCLKDHGAAIDNWQWTLLTAIKTYLSEWDQYSAYFSYSIIIKKANDGRCKRFNAFVL